VTQNERTSVRALIWENVLTRKGLATPLIWSKTISDVLRYLSVSSLWTLVGARLQRVPDSLALSDVGKVQIRDHYGLYFVTSTIVYWIDLFTRREFKHLIVESLIHCQEKKGLIVHAWCLMPSHLHMIISTRDQPLPRYPARLQKIYQQSHRAGNRTYQ